MFFLSFIFSTNEINIDRSFPFFFLNIKNPSLETSGSFEVQKPNTQFFMTYNDLEVFTQHDLNLIYKAISDILRSKDRIYYQLYLEINKYKSNIQSLNTKESKLCLIDSLEIIKVFSRRLSVILLGLRKTRVVCNKIYIILYKNILDNRILLYKEAICLINTISYKSIDELKRLNMSFNYKDINFTNIVLRIRKYQDDAFPTFFTNLLIKCVENEEGIDLKEKNNLKILLYQILTYFKLMRNFYRKLLVNFQ